MYLKHDVFKRGKVLLSGLEITDIKKISHDPVLFSATIEGEKWCLNPDDITDVKPVKKK
jgi:hypothetical protein